MWVFSRRSVRSGTTRQVLPARATRRYDPAHALGSNFSTLGAWDGGGGCVWPPQANETPSAPPATHRETFTRPPSATRQYPRLTSRASRGSQHRRGRLLSRRGPRRPDLRSTAPTATAPGG